MSGNVCKFPPKKTDQEDVRPPADNERWLWFKALEIAGLLPHDAAEIRIVLGYVDVILATAPKIDSA